MLTLQKFKFQVSTEFLLIFSFLLSLFIALFLIFLKNEKDVEDLKRFYENYQFCIELAKELNFILTLQSNISLKMSFEKEAKVQNFTILVDNVFCRTRVKEILTLNNSIAILKGNLTLIKTNEKLYVI